MNLIFWGVSSNDDASVLKPNQVILNHLETNLHACLDYWTMGQDDLKAGWQQRLIFCLEKDFNLNSASVYEQVMSYLEHRIKLIATLPGYNPDLISRARQLHELWKKLNQYPDIHYYLTDLTQNVERNTSEFLPKVNQEILPELTPQIIIQSYLKTFAQLPETKNSTLIQFMATHGNDLDRIKQMAKERQHRNASKFNGLWFAGRNTNIVQAMYDEIVKRGDAFAFDQEFLTFLENLKPTHSKKVVNLPADPVAFLAEFSNKMQDHLRGSSGMAKIVKIIQASETSDVNAIIFQMRSIAQARQHRVWSKLSIFGKGRDTEIIQPLYDLMARRDFDLNQDGIDDLKRILNRLPHPTVKVSI